MQTFLPLPHFTETAKILDYRRLGKMRIEPMQILAALAGETAAWSNHPCTRMWRGFEGTLASYGITMCNEWLARGYKDNCKNKLIRYLELFSPNSGRPPFLDNERFLLGHKSNLIRKFPEYYRKFWPDVPDNLSYIWSV